MQIKTTLLQTWICKAVFFQPIEMKDINCSYCELCTWRQLNIVGNFGVLSCSASAALQSSKHLRQSSTGANCFSDSSGYNSPADLAGSGQTCILHIRRVNAVTDLFLSATLPHPYVCLNWWSDFISRNFSLLLKCQEYLLIA